MPGINNILFSTGDAVIFFSVESSTDIGLIMQMFEYQPW